MYEPSMLEQSNFLHTIMLLFNVIILKWFNIIIIFIYLRMCFKLYTIMCLHYTYSQFLNLYVLICCNIYYNLYIINITIVYFTNYGLFSSLLLIFIQLLLNYTYSSFYINKHTPVPKSLCTSFYC